jgi:uncharacterized protein YndB with AHSA1/START domain
VHPERDDRRRFRTRIAIIFWEEERKCHEHEQYISRGQYVELVPDEGLRYIDKFGDLNLPGQLQVTVTLKKVPVGMS